MGVIRIINGNSLVELPKLDECSVDSCVTDPPYELGFMGKAWDKSGIAYNVDLWRQVFRVLKPGAHLIAFGGTRTYHRMVCAIEDAGFEIRDQIQWIYGSGFPKSLDLGNGLGTALKPANEPICLGRKPLEKRLTVVQNITKWGTGGLNIGGCRVRTDEPLEGGATGKRTALMSMGGTNPRPNHSRAGEASARRRYKQKGSTTFAALPGRRSNESEGRFPANVIHDGSDEVLARFPQQTSGANPTRRSSAKSKNVYGSFAGQSECEPVPDAESGSAARFFYCAKTNKSDRHSGLPMPPACMSHGSLPHDWENTDRKGNHHPTVKPTDLMRYLCRLVTPAGGIVLDPFLGSGSTAKAALIERFKVVGIELDSEYASIADARCRELQTNLFA